MEGLVLRPCKHLGNYSLHVTFQNITVKRRFIHTDEPIRPFADYIAPKVCNPAGVVSAGVLVADDCATSTFAGGSL